MVAPDETEWTEEIDRLLLTSVGVKSTAEIAKELGIGPLDVRKRVNELLESIDVLTITQQRQKIMIGLNDLINRASERLDAIGTGLSDREWAQIMSASTNAARTLLAELARMEDKDEAALQELNRKRVQELLRLVDITIVNSVEEISERYDLNEDELMDVFSARLQEAAIELDLGA